MRRVVALILLLGSVATAQPQSTTPPGQPFPSPRVYSLPDFWLQLNSAPQVGEWAEGEHQLFYRAYPSWFDGNFAWRAPQVIYRQPWLNLVAGTQESSGLDALLDYAPFHGARADWDVLGLRWTAAGGRSSTENLPRLVLGPDIERYDLYAVGLAAPLERGLIRLAHSGWSPSNPAAGPDSHHLFSLEIDPALRGPFTVGASYGIDAGSQVAPSEARRAYSWRAGYQGDRFSFNFQQQANGRAYGPRLEQNYRRGENLMLADAHFRLSPQLDLNETFQALVLDTPIEQPFQRLLNQTWLHQLTWRPDNGLRLTGQYQNNRARSLGFTPRTFVQELYRLDAYYRPGVDWELAARGGRRISAQSSATEAGLSLVHFPAEEHRVALAYDFVTGASSGGGSQLALNYQYRPDDTLNFWLDYSHLEQDRAGASDSVNLGLRWYPTARWTLGGNVAASRAPSVAIRPQYQVEASYLFDDHQELAFRYTRNPFLDDILGVGRTVSPGSAFMLELRESWGGGMERGFHARLQPRLQLEVLARPGGGEAEYAPVPGARVRLGTLEPQRSDDRGRIYFSGLEAGDYALQLDLESLGPNYEVVEAPPAELRLEPGDRLQAGYRLIAWASVYAVVFNDVAGSGTLPVGYLPYPRIPVRLIGPEGETRLQTDSQGVARFPRLPAGRYTVELAPELLSPEITVTTPARFAVELSPGQEQVLDIGLRAFAHLRADVLVRDRSGLTPAPAGWLVFLKGQELGRVGEGGRIDLEVPAGALELEIKAPPDMYLENPELLQLDLAPAQLAEGKLILARYATLKVRFSRPAEGVALELSPGAFLYTDDKGVAVFDRLRAGEYAVTLSPDSLPRGYRLAGPARMTVRLAPGEVRELTIPVQKQ